MEFYKGLQCCVCLEAFSDTHPPRSFQCGHSVCTLCILRLLPIQRHCPECRKQCHAKVLRDLPVNHVTLQLSRFLRYNNLQHEDKPTVDISRLSLRKNVVPNIGKCPDHGHSMFFVCLRCVVLVCRECLAENHPDPPRGRCNIVEIMKGMFMIRYNHQKVINSYLLEAQKAEKRLRHFLDGWTCVSNYYKEKEYDKDNPVYESNLQETKKHTDSIQAQIVALEYVKNGLQEAMKNLMKNYDPGLIKITTEQCLKSESACERYMAQNKILMFNPFLNLVLPRKMEMKDLLSQDAPVYAIHEEDGKSRWSQVVLKNSRIHLFSLRDGVPPGNGICLPFKVLRAAVQQDYPVVFMEISWDDESQGFVYIQLFGNTARSRQTVLLCSGERGPSYRNTCFFDIGPEGVTDFFLRGGDYENNDGTGGRAIVDDIKDEKSKMEVELYTSCSACLSQFGDEQPPRNLKCGHLLCSICLDIILVRRRRCPECRWFIPFRFRNAGYFSINQSILQASRILSFLSGDQDEMPLPKLALKLGESKPRLSAGTCSTHGYSLFFFCLSCEACICRGCLAVLHVDPPRGHCCIVDFQYGMDKIKNNHLERLEEQLKEALSISAQLLSFMSGCDLILQHFMEKGVGFLKGSYDEIVCDVSTQREEAQSRVNMLENLTMSLEVASEIVRETDIGGFINASKACWEAEHDFSKFVKDKKESKLHLLLQPLPNRMVLEQLLTTITPIYATLQKGSKNIWSLVKKEDNIIRLCSMGEGTPPGNCIICLPFILLRVTVPLECSAEVVGISLG